MNLQGVIRYPDPVPFASHLLELTRSPELWRCEKCRSAYVENTIHPQEALALYISGDSAGRWEATAFETDKTNRLVDFVAGAVKRGSVVLDFGCNDGVLLDFLSNQGCKTYGVEASATARAIASAKGHTVVGTLEEITEQQSFSTIFAMDVVEHLYDVSGFLAQVRKHLAPGGRLVLLTGNINSITARMARNKWWYIRYPEHVRFPSLKWLNRYSGFRVEKAASVHASKGYVHPLTRAGLMSGLRRWWEKEYDGMPVIWPDHYVVSLKPK